MVGQKHIEKNLDKAYPVSVVLVNQKRVF